MVVIIIFYDKLWVVKFVFFAWYLYQTGWIVCNATDLHLEYMRVRISTASTVYVKFVMVSGCFDS